MILLTQTRIGNLCEGIKNYFKITAPGVSKAKIIYSFNTVDTNEDGVISREEFMAAAEDYFCGVEETEVSKVFLGHLVK